MDVEFDRDGESGGVECAEELAQCGLAAFLHPGTIQGLRQLAVVVGVGYGRTGPVTRVSLSVMVVGWWLSRGPVVVWWVVITGTLGVGRRPAGAWSAPNFPDGCLCGFLRVVVLNADLVWGPVSEY